jgi:hypothetical protein
LITDLSNFVPGSPGAAAALTQGGEMIKTKGRRHGIRITGGLMTGLMQFQRLLRAVFDEEKTRYAKSLEEADAMLDSWTEETEPTTVSPAENLIGIPIHCLRLTKEV